jgi:hypothetical protein
MNIVSVVASTLFKTILPFLGIRLLLFEAVAVAGIAATGAPLLAITGIVYGAY